MSEDATIWQQIAKLSPEDRDRYQNDMVAFGSAMLKEHEDGTVTYVPPDQWPPELKEKSS